MKIQLLWQKHDPPMDIDITERQEPFIICESSDDLSLDYRKGN